jgi:ATP-dependent Clp protease ATP-binding subunit ClpA
MPKINVYLPDDLADTVKDLGLPVSAICQRALEQSVRRVSAIRAVGDLTGEDPTVGLVSFTDRAKDALKHAIAGAKDRGVTEVGTRDLLLGILAEGTNMAVRVLQALDLDPSVVQHELRQLPPESTNGNASRFSGHAANALELTVVEALTLGHNYVGCEHLLLGLLAEPDGAAGQVLRGMGLDSKIARQTVSAALAGLVHMQAKQGAIQTAVTKALAPVMQRLDRLEEKAGLK